MRHAEVNKSAFFWSGLFVLLPLLFLAGVGLYSLREDRLLADAEARNQCQNAAELCAQQIANSIAAAEAPSELPTFTLDSRCGLIAICGSPDKALTSDLPQPHSMPAAQRLYDLALISTNAQFASNSFSELAKNRDATTAGGLPLWLLAEFQLFQRNPTAAVADALCSDAVNFPSFVTPNILENVGKKFPIERWLQIWSRDQLARDLYSDARPQLSNNLSSFWMTFQGQPWLLHQNNAQEARRVSAIPFAQVRSLVFSALDIRPPPYAILIPTIAGKEISDLLSGVRQVSTYPELAHATINDVTVVAVLQNPALLYAQQRRRTLWFAAIILISAAAATAALIALHRAFHQQIRLSEMKTNFVSSVSHELRAPIASMRLLAEGLDRGKISDPPKQREYYKLLAQESRRLSTLIENILDYSRIDQGRKSYEIEPANLAALVQQTVALMAPAAADRRVSIIPPVADALADPNVTCDGLALQQALINLIDNAIKHSPPDSAVTVGLNRNNGRVSLWVEDHGPGIPIDERDKIFERFYRRGSELRRETQGIGIGLTIVKHIIEAHSGRVLVSDAPGSGSRFTLEWPA